MKTHRIMLVIDDDVVKDLKSHWSIGSMCGGVGSLGDAAMHLIIEQIKKGEDKAYIRLNKKKKAKT